MTDRILPSALGFALFCACSHGASRQPVEATVAPPPLDGTYLVERLSPSDGPALIELHGTIATVQADLDSAEKRTAEVEGTFPWYRIGVGKEMPFRLLLASRDTGWMWRHGYSPSPVHRVVTLPETMRGNWVGIDPTVPSKQIVSLELSPGEMAVSERERDRDVRPVRFVATSDGGLGIFDASDRGGERKPREMIEVFPVQDALVMVFKGSAFLVHRPGKAPAWLDGREGPTRSAEPVATRTFRFLDVNATLALGPDGASLGSESSRNTALALLSRSGPLSRHTLKQEYRGEEPVAVFTETDRAWVWLEGRGGLALETTARPREPSGEWSAAVVSGGLEEYTPSKVVFSDQEARFVTSNGEKTLVRSSGGFLFVKDGKPLQLFKLPTGWLLAEPQGSLVLLHRGPAPAWAPSKAKMTEQLGQLCEAASHTPRSDPFEKRFGMSLVAVSERGELVEPLEMALTAISQVGSSRRAFLSMVVSSLGLTLPPCAEWDSLFSPDPVREDQDRVLKARRFWESDKSATDGETLSLVALATFVEMEKGRLPDSIYENLRNIGSFGQSSDNRSRYLGSFIAKNVPLAARVIGMEAFNQLPNVPGEQRAQFIRANLKVDLGELLSANEARQLDHTRLMVAAMLYKSIVDLGEVIHIERALLRSYLLGKHEK